MQVLVDGRETALHAGPRTSIGVLIQCIQNYLRATGRKVGSVLLDGEELREEDLEKRVGEDGSPLRLEIRTVDPQGPAIEGLRRAADLLPGAQLDLGFAARSLREGDPGAGLQALFEAITVLGTVEEALRSVEGGGGAPATETEDAASALERLRAFLCRIRDALQVQDLDAVATAVRDDGREVVAASHDRIRSEIDMRVALRTL